MLTIELRSPAGRFHATPWDRHVNEGVVEWPPSPWRLLRALVATWHLKAQAEMNREQLASLVEALASAHPSYRLPAGTASHTRHYMPLYHPDKTTKIFDTFVHVAKGTRVLVTWPTLELPTESRAALDSLLSCMGYLGRAESWTEGRVLPPEEETGEVNTCPLDDGAEADPDHEIVRVLTPMTDRALRDWSGRALEKALARALAEKQARTAARGKDATKLKLNAADRRKTQAGLPNSVLDALSVDTRDLHKARWSGIPGAIWVDYVRPRSLLLLTPHRKPRRHTGALPAVARFAVASQVPPRLTHAVFVAERIRTALISLSEGAAVFTGKNDDGSPASGHRHAFILPEANADHGRITHVTLYASMGFDDLARRAIERLRKVWGRDNHDLQLVPIGVGRPSDFAGRNLAAGQCPLLVESTTWISRTPFVNPRHPKLTRRGALRLDESALQIGSPQHELTRLLAASGFPLPVHIESMDGTELSGKPTSWRDFHTQRREGGGRRGPSRASGFLVRFPDPVRGPLALGYGAHFGLGVFTPNDSF